MLAANASTKLSLSETVIDGGYCVGCGACASTQSPQFQMKFSDLGTYVPVRIAAQNDDESQVPEKVCPFSNSAPNESQIAHKLYADAPNFDSRIGHYREIYVGSATTGGFRERGSSGGLTNWVLSRLMESGAVDAVVGVGERRESIGPLFRYQIARTVDDIKLFSKSKYYPVELSEVIAEIRAKPGRYAIVVVPCFAKAIRSLCEQDELLASRITFVVAIVCGHLKSAGFAESLAWQVGVPPNALQKIDFRLKIKNQPANRYAIRAEGTADGQAMIGTRQVFDLYGSDWGLGFFKLQACDFCEDVAGETADITLGDAWLPNEVKDWRGTNIVIVRSALMQSLLVKGSSNDEIALRESSSNEFIRSQDANYRHRHDGMAYRLHRKDLSRVWRPKKRIDASLQRITQQRQRMMDARASLAAKSQVAFSNAKAKGHFREFKRDMRTDVLRYYSLANSLIKYLAKNVVILARRLIN